VPGRPYRPAGGAVPQAAPMAARASVHPAEL